MHVFQAILCGFVAFHPNYEEFDTAKTWQVQDFSCKLLLERGAGFPAKSFSQMFYIR